MFYLNEQNCKLRSVNLRAEFNGPDEARSACELSIEAKMNNDCLSMFDAKLKAAFYEKEDDSQGELIEAENHLTKLRFAELNNTLKWIEEFEGVTVVVNYGIGGPSDVKLTDCRLKKFVFELQEGGTVCLNFSAQAHPTPADIGKLSELIQQEVKVTVRPPNDAEKSETEERTAAREKLHGLFSHGDGPPVVDDEYDPHDDDGGDDPRDEASDRQDETNPLAIE